MNTPLHHKSKKKMQNVSFSSVDEFLEFLPRHELDIVEPLRELILNSIPGCKEKLSYNVPYYYRHANICFIWPSSITWGNVKTTGVRLGFTSGNLLRDEINYLDKGERKQVYCKDFFSPEEIDFPLLKSYLFEAMQVDNERAKSKKRK